MTAVRGPLGKFVRALSVATLTVTYAGSLWLTYRQLRARTPLEGALGAPGWTHAVLVMGLVVGGGLGVAAAIVDARREQSSWLITVVGTAAALVWSLWVSDSEGLAVGRTVFAAAPPFVALLVLTELMRQLRGAVRGKKEA
ncbi:hypothetical protein ACWD4B_23460 [Streptomyces sp. NPDC002536]